MSGLGRDWCRVCGGVVVLVWGEGGGEEDLREERRAEVERRVRDRERASTRLRGVP